MASITASIVVRIHILIRIHVFAVVDFIFIARLG